MTWKNPFPVKITATFRVNSGTDSQLFQRDYAYIFVSPNINGNTEKASKTAAANYVFPYQNPVLIICKCYTSVNQHQQSLILEEKVLICGMGRQDKTLLT